MNRTPPPLILEGRNIIKISWNASHSNRIAQIYHIFKSCAETTFWIFSTPCIYFSFFQISTNASSRSTIAMSTPSASTHQETTAACVTMNTTAMGLSVYQSVSYLYDLVYLITEQLVFGVCKCKSFCFLLQHVQYVSFTPSAPLTI